MKKVVPLFTFLNVEIEIYNQNSSKRMISKLNNRSHTGELS